MGAKPIKGTPELIDSIFEDAKNGVYQSSEKDFSKFSKDVISALSASDDDRYEYSKALSKTTASVILYEACDELSDFDAEEAWKYASYFDIMLRVWNLYQTARYVLFHEVGEK